MKITRQVKINNLISEIQNNLNFTLFHVGKVIKDNSINAFAKLKFGKVGFDSISGVSINFIEMLKQAYYVIDLLKAASELLKKCPSKTFELNIGASSEIYIYSSDGDVAVEFLLDF